MQTTDMMVSVYCLAYNQENYIRSALEGFVTQKTNFPYEVLVHDDASTDKTAEIIREYAEKYPHIIKPIFQTRNQYSQGINITQTHIRPRVTGKYIAVCEGDDYWCDANKLQKQVDFMEAHPEYSACVHNTRMINQKTGKETILYPDREYDIVPEMVIPNPGIVCHTTSFFYRSKYLFSRPGFLTAITGVGDYPLTIYLAMEGKIHYFPEVMSVYRIYSQGSWTNRMQRDRSMAVRTQTQFIQMLKMADEYSQGRYRGIFAEAIALREYKLLKAKGENKAAIQHPYFKRANRQEKLKMYAKVCFPWLLELKRKWKR